jgi:hypothetical protein
MMDKKANHFRRHAVIGHHEPPSFCRTALESISGSVYVRPSQSSLAARKNFEKAKVFKHG